LGAFEELHRGLMLKTIQSMDDTWPVSTTYTGGRIGEPHDYVPKLATMVLVADAHKQSFITAPGLPCVLIGMDDAVWGRTLAGRYLELQRQYGNTSVGTRLGSATGSASWEGKSPRES
jgi:hypothetical protein